jgi:hypothetical protein
MRLLHPGTSSIDALRQELRQHALSSLRWRLGLGLPALYVVADRLKPMYTSMNVELPWTSAKLMTLLGFVGDWWWLSIPVLLLGYRLAEREWLESMPFTPITNFSRFSLVAILLALWSIVQPMFILTVNIG